MKKSGNYRERKTAQDFLTMLGETFTLISPAYDLIEDKQSKKKHNAAKCYSLLFNRESPCANCPLSTSLETRQPAATIIHPETIRHPVFVKAYPITGQNEALMVQHENVADLVQSTALFDKLFDDIPLAFLLTDPELNIRYASPGIFNLFPFVKNPIQGKDLRLVISRHHPPFPKKLLDFFFSLQPSPSQHSEEFRLAYPIDRDVKVFSFSHSRKEKASKSDRDGFFILFIDDTEDSIRQSLAFQRALIKETQHIFGQLHTNITQRLTNILSLCDQMAAKDLEQPDRKMLLHKLKEESHHLKKQLADLNSFIPRKSIALKEINLHGLIQRVIKEFEADFKKNQVKLKTSFTRHLKPFQAPPDIIQKILKSLLQNALEGIIEKRKLSNKPYAPAIMIQTRMQGSEIELMIKDNGCGMAESETAQSFLPGYTNKDPAKHTGMGLFLCQAFLRALNGKITLSSVKGVGTKVSLRIPSALPLQKDKEGNKATPQLTSKEKPASGLFSNLPIWLLGEKDPSMEFIQKFLFKNGAIIQEIPDTDVLMKSLKEKTTSPSAIILNITDEKKSHALSIALKEKNYLEKTLFVAPEELYVPFKRRYKETGAAFIKKPFPIETFTDALISLISPH